MNPMLIVGKYLDQPRLVGKFSKAVPAMLIAGGTVFTFDHLQTTPKEDKHKELIKSISVLTTTIGSAIISTRGLRQIKLGNKVLFKGFKGLSENIDLKEVVKKNTELVNDFFKNNTTSEKTSKFLEKIKTKILNFTELKTIYEELHPQKNGKEFLKNLIPDPENVDSKHIFSEIGRLSIIGLIPVLGGIAGGIIGDKLTEKNWKEKIPNKIKEGSYQYLANIALCNVGAGIALWILEKAKINSKSARAIGMTVGILAVGVIGGSAIANLIGKVLIDPILDHGKKNDTIKKGLYSERKPEAIDLGLHSDDLASVAVLSGLKWIEPALPILYSVSGYRAGVGYRN